MTRCAGAGEIQERRADVKRQIFLCVELATQKDSSPEGDFATNSKTEPTTAPSQSAKW